MVPQVLIENNISQNPILHLNLSVNKCTTSNYSSNFFQLLDMDIEILEEGYSMTAISVISSWRLNENSNDIIVKLRKDVTTW